MRQRPAFTLIEVLVVLGILSVLIAILVPSLSKARARSRTVACLSNQRSLAQAMQAYYVDWGNPHVLSLYGSRTWFLMLFGDGKALALPLGVNGNDLGSVPTGSACRKIMICPETSAPDIKKPHGTAHRQWYVAVGGPLEGSYDINGWLFEFQGSSSLVTYRDVGLRSGSVIPLFLDGTGATMWATPDDPGAKNTEDPAGEGQENLTTNCINRHNMAVNVVFFDAHAENVKLPDLWTLKWTADWTRTEPAVVSGTGK